MMSSKKKNKKNETITYNNKNVGFSISIPNSWLEVKKTSYNDLGINDNTLFVFVADEFTTVSAIFSGFCKRRSFNKLFDKVTFNEKIKILKTGQNEYNNVSVKYVIIEDNNRKIMNNFCVINDMIINFTINIDPKNRLIDNKGLTTDKNYKMINEVLKNIKVYKPVNPPILIEDIVTKEDPIVENKRILDKKTTAQLYIENDCKYRNILLPQFYFKYMYNKNNSYIMLSIIDNELYFKGLNDCFRIVKVDEFLADKICEIITKNIDNLEKMNINYKKAKSSNYLAIKIKELYLYIDLSDVDNDYDLLNKLLNNIVSEIGKVTKKDFSKYEILPKMRNVKKVIISDAVGKEAETILQKLNSEITKKEKAKSKKVIISDAVGKEAEAILNKINNQMEIKNNNKKVIISDEVRKEASKVLKKLENEIPKMESNSKPKEVPKKENNNVIPFIISKEAEVVLNKIDNEEKYNQHQPGQKKREYDLTTFEEYFHNVDGHASFKFLFPPNSGEKIIRDFNVFDISDNDELSYRVFIFKCETYEKYEIKLDNWMNMNIDSNQTKIKDKYTRKTDNNTEIRTYIFENGKFYKVTYKNNYLISISGIEDEEKLFYADLALDTVEIGEDSKTFVEAYDRKVRSIKTLQAQGIPYIDELPVIESSYEITGKTLEEIAKRAIVLCISCNFASDLISNKKRRYLKESKKFFNKLLDTYNVKDVMTKDEKNLFDKMNKNLAIQISWQFEGYVILLWTLGLIDEIEFPDSLVDPDSVTAIVSACDNYREFIEKCQLRDVHEVLDLADLTYRYNWYCVEAKINGEEPIINPEVVVERHRALNWLLSDKKWDNVEINT